MVTCNCLTINSPQISNSEKFRTNFNLPEWNVEMNNRKWTSWSKLGKDIFFCVWTPLCGGKIVGFTALSNFDHSFPIALCALFVGLLRFLSGRPAVFLPPRNPKRTVTNKISSCCSGRAFFLLVGAPPTVMGFGNPSINLKILFPFD